MKNPLPKGISLNSKKGKKVFEGGIFSVYQWRQKLFDGTYDTYETLKRSDSVNVIPVIGEEIVAVIEKQPHWKKFELCIIGGRAEKGEGAEEAARREVEEETGMVFKDYYLIDVGQVMPGIEWFGYTFIAKNLIEVKEKDLDAGEKNRVTKISFEKLIETTRKGKFYYRPRAVEKYILQDKIPEFFDLLRNPNKYKDIF